MRRGLFMLGLGGYALGLVATLPATWVDAGLQRASGGRLRLTEARGTLWAGSGQIEIRDAGGRAGIAKPLAWRFLPASLLRGQILCEIELDHAAKRLPVAISPARIELADADIDLPATALGLGVPRLAPLGLGGNVRLYIERLDIGRNRMQGSATLQWRAASSALTPVSPLGDYELRLENDGAATHAVLRTLRGPLHLDGKGAWANGANPTFLGSAHIPQAHRQQLSPLLRLIAIERSEGSFELGLR